MSDQSNKAVYPIQPTYITVREIHFISHRPPSKNDRIDDSDVKLSQFVSAFNPEHKRVQVTLSAEFGFEDGQAVARQPFSLKVLITGEFSIGDDFPRDMIPVWTAKNAPFVIYPYLRERVYSICLQGGYPPLILPLLQIPTIKIDLSKQELGLHR